MFRDAPFDRVSRALGRTTSRREVLRLLALTVAGGALASLGVGCSGSLAPTQPDPCPAGTTGCGDACCPPGQQCRDGTCVLEPVDACLVASFCGARQYCNDEQSCLCLETPEGDKRCGRIPDSCEVEFCESSADCAHLGEGYFCDTPTSGCCDEQRSRCIAPCDAAPDAAIRGRFGSVSYRVEVGGETAAQARYALDGGGELRVEIAAGDRGTMVWGGTAIDGFGPLAGEQEAALADLAADGVMAYALAMAPLELACERDDVPPAALAALLLPWQLLLKYHAAAPAEEIRSAADQASCLYFASPREAYESSRPLRAYPLLSYEDPFPNVFGFAPFDAAGALAAQRLAPQVQQDRYGPGGATCRGACGPDCEPANCGTPSEAWRCITENGSNTGYKELWLVYSCGTHAGCREHDDCYDFCKDRFGADGWDSFMCHRECDQAAVDKYGFADTNAWRTGGGPFDATERYEYRISSPFPDQQMCPTQVYCSCNQTCYDSAPACLDACRTSLGCFTGICEPAAPGQCG